jgi:predicted amidophosphoribosyltransferase
MPLSDLIALIAPPLCLGCRVPVPAGAVALCAACVRRLPWLGDRVCRRCALPSHGGRACPASGARFATAWAPMAYEGTALVLLRALKFRGALPVADLMAAQMAANAPPWAVGDATAVVAVPPVPGRARRRGYDPAALLAAGLGRRLGLPVVGCLARSGRAARQLGARRAERRAPGRIGIRVTAAPPASVLLVDDVHTTGATLAACARGLTGGHATTVRALSYARTM